jgi:hypothetical protein
MAHTCFSKLFSKMSLPEQIFAFLRYFHSFPPKSCCHCAIVLQNFHILQLYSLSDDRIIGAIDLKQLDSPLGKHRPHVHWLHPLRCFNPMSEPRMSEPRITWSKGGVRKKRRRLPWFRAHATVFAIRITLISRTSKNNSFGYGVKHVMPTHWTGRRCWSSKWQRLDSRNISAWHVSLINASSLHEQIYKLLSQYDIFPTTIAGLVSVSCLGVSCRSVSRIWISRYPEEFCTLPWALSYTPFLVGAESMTCCMESGCWCKNIQTTRYALTTLSTLLRLSGSLINTFEYQWSSCHRISCQVVDLGREARRRLLCTILRGRQS